MQIGVKSAATIFVFVISALACTKKPELSSQIVVQLPKAAETSASSKYDHFDKRRKLSVMSELSWGISRPTTLAETQCFAVVVELPESEISGGSEAANRTCTTTAAQGKTIYVQHFAGLAAAGSQIEFNISPGPGRTFHLFAFAAESTGDCTLTDAGSLLRKSALSGPLLIGSTKQDIVSGSNNIEIIGRYSDGVAYENCNWSEPPPLVGGAFQIDSGATHTRFQSVTLTPQLPFVVSQAYYTQDSTCKTGGVWEPYSTARSGYSIGTGDGSKQVYARFRDSAGSVSDCMSASIILDQTVPAVALNAPPPANIMSAPSYSVSGTCSEEGRPVNITIGTLNTSANCVGGFFSVSSEDITSLADGMTSLGASQSDLAGNTGTVSQSFSKDTVAPSITLTSPANGSYINATTQTGLNVSGTCSDSGQAVLIYLDGTLLTTATCMAGSYSAMTDVSTFGDGARTVSVETFDLAGNFGGFFSPVTKDTVPPVASILNVPAPIHMATTYTTLIGGADVTDYRWKNASSSADCYSGAGYAGPFPIATPINQITMTPQTHAICVLGVDAAGNEQPVGSATFAEFTKGPVLVSFTERWSSSPDSVGMRLLDISISPPLTIPETLYLEAQGSALAGTHYTGFINGLSSIPLPSFASTTQALVSVIGSSIALEEKRLSVSLTGASNPGIQVGETGTHQLWIESSSAPFYGLTNISLGVSSGCGINAANKLYCWGSNSSGQIGNGNTIIQPLPIHIDVANSYQQVAVGNGYACAIRFGGQLTCWGVNSSGQLGDGTTTPRNLPVVIDSGTSYIKVSTYASTTCGVTIANQLKCWGNKLYGQVGDGISSGTQTTPVLINAGNPYIDVAMGADHACAVRMTGEVDCWGRGDLGQIGDGNTLDRNMPTQVSSLSGIQKIYSGQKYSCALDTIGKAFCWGEGTTGKLGNSMPDPSSTPVPSQPTYSFASLALSSNTTCGIDLADSKAKCWGYSYYGLLGNDSRGMAAYAPVTAWLPSPATSVAGNSNSMCAVANGRAFCWGNANNSHLGNGTFNRMPWTQMSVQRDHLKMSLGRGGCGIGSADGALSCWGPNDIENATSAGQIGDGSTMRRFAPVLVDRPYSYNKVSVGTQHTCGITVAGELRCWGFNNSGQLGIGNTTNQSLPAPVASAYFEVSAGIGFTCGIDGSNVVNCWGKNDVGQLGLGDTVSRNVPTSNGVSSAIKVSAGANHACAIDSFQSLFCWGKNSNGQLGLGDTTDRIAPMPISGSWIDVSAGALVTCAINSSSALYCWGRNQSAEIGQGSISPSNHTFPIQIAGLYTKVQVGSLNRGNGTHVCALTTAGQLNCWGANNLGQNDYVGAPGNVLSPTPVDASTYVDFAVGEAHTCGKTSAGMWFCRGFGQESHLPIGISPAFPNLLPNLNY